MTDPDQTLQSIDDALDDYDQWDGVSLDAARWRGGPNEDDQPENEPRETDWSSLDLHDFMRDTIGGSPAEWMMPTQTYPTEPLTVEGMMRVMRRIRDSEPRAIVSPATASQIRQAAHEAGQQVDVIVSEHVPDGQAYIFRPPPLQRCCDAGTRATPGPCPWHGGQP